MSSSADFADRLVELMARRGDISQQSLADRLGVTRASINDWRRGRAIPAPATIFAIEQALDIRPGELSRTLGYLPLDAEEKRATTVLEAIAVDPDLNDEGRRLLRIVYEELTARRDRPASG